MISDIFKHAGRILHRVVFPPKCLVCTAFIPDRTNPCGSSGPLPAANGNSASLSLHRQLDRMLSRYLCRNCILGLVAVESPICDCCGFPFESRKGVDHRCGDCITHPKFFEIARAPLVYDQVAMRVIQRFKYNGKLQLVRPLAELLLMTYRMFWKTDSVDLVVPVPLHLSRFRSRGFNQAYLMANCWKKIAGDGENLSNGHRLERELLIRSRATLPQTSLGREQRTVNMKNAFTLNNSSEIMDKHILLVDDVYTTGATVNECARVLVNGGAGRVDVLTLARAI